jgi:TonB family protein
MRMLAIVVAVALAAGAPRAEAPRFDGTWHLRGGDQDDSAKIYFLTRSICDIVRSPGYESVGFFDGTQYHGVLREHDGPDLAVGVEDATLDSAGVLHLVDTFTPGRSHTVETAWTREAPALSPDPAPGEYVATDELPEAIHKVPPQYPDAARKADIEGRVIVSALVGRDGLVKDVRVVKSIAPLDEAAMAAVRQWAFKPAMKNGEPVSVWVTVPVNFTLH